MTAETVSDDLYDELNAFAKKLLQDAPTLEQKLPVGVLSVASAFGLVEQELRVLGVDISQHPNSLANVALGIVRKIDGVTGLVRQVSFLPQLPAFNILKGTLQRRIAELWIPSGVDDASGTNVICAEYSGEVRTSNAGYLFDKTVAIRATVIGADEVVYTALPGLRTITARPNPESVLDATASLANLVRSALEYE